MTKSTLTRRALVASTAAIPAAAALSLPAGSSWAAPTLTEEADPVIAIAEQAMKAWQEYESATKVFGPFAAWDWRHKRYVSAAPDRSAREAADRAFAAINELIFEEPRTFAGLAAMARVARVTGDEDLYISLARAIGFMAGEISPDDDSGAVS